MGKFKEDYPNLYNYILTEVFPDDVDTITDMWINYHNFEDPELIVMVGKEQSSCPIDEINGFIVYSELLGTIGDRYHEHFCIDLNRLDYSEKIITDFINNPK